MSKCHWCSKDFAPRRGCALQRFCTPQCRAGYHKATRVWAEQEITAGRVTIEAIRDGAAVAYTGAGDEEGR